MTTPYIMVVDPWDWLEDGDFPRNNLRLRRKSVRVARLIEYGGPIERGEHAPTLVECTRRPGRRQCEGLLWVFKTETDAIVAYCEECRAEQFFIENWQDTIWADGPLGAI